MEERLGLAVGPGSDIVDGFVLQGITTGNKLIRFAF
jgi:hypothetical protein